MHKIVLLALIAILMNCSGKSAISADQYARFTAKRTLIQDYYRNKPDSLDRFLAGLYKSEGVSQVQISNFVSKTNKEPEQWIEIQQKVVAEMEKLNPARPNPAPPRH